MNSSDTRERLLDAAQMLFVAQGIDATSLRNITTEAEANIASVNYYFGSKHELVHAVFARHLTPLNEERIRLLDALEQDAGLSPLTLESILEAFFSPAFEMMHDPKSRQFVSLLGKLFTESHELKMSIFQQFQEVQVRYFAALRRTLPELPLPDLTWRVHFMIGAMAHTFLAPDKMSIPSPPEIYQISNQDIMRKLIDFAVAGLKAPLTPKQNGDQTS